MLLTMSSRELKMPRIQSGTMLARWRIRRVMSVNILRMGDALKDAKDAVKDTVKSSKKTSRRLIDASKH